jgi:hypothetical protein
MARTAPRGLECGLCLGLLLVFALPSVARGQSSTEIVRGRVTGRDSLPIPDAEIIITGLVTRIILTAHSDAKGVYTALFPNPEGDYLLQVRKIGYIGVSFRLTRTGIASILSADVVLQSRAFRLDSIIVTADRLLSTGENRSVGGLEQDALLGTAFLLDPSQLLALALSVPGVLSVGDSGYSVLGAAANQNAASLDGAKFSGGNLPRDAVAASRIVTTTADPARGGFSGGQQSTTLRGGTDIFAATLRATFANPTLAWADPEWPQPVPRIIGGSGSVGGPLRRKKAHYLFSWDLLDNSTAAYSLLAPRSSLLSQTGIAPDTVTAVAEALQHLSIPLTASGLPSNRYGRRYTTALVLDFTPRATTSLRLTHTGTWSRNGGPNAGLLAFPSAARQNANSDQFMSAKLSQYGHGFLDELTASVEWFSGRNAPYLVLPAAVVQVGTVFSDGRTGLGALRFGGGAGFGRNRWGTATIQNELSWLTRDSKHRVKFGQSLEADRRTSFRAGNQFGTYFYYSLADLQANAPASYTQTLGTTEHPSRGKVLAGWLGDEWSPSKAWQFQGGIRLDAVLPGTPPAYNASIDSLFGIRTDRLPNNIGVTPRFGFSWSPKARREKGSPSAGASQAPFNDPSSLGNAYSPERMAQLIGQRRNTLPGILVSGTFGGYRGLTSLGTGAALLDYTGRPDTRRTLSCVGVATPVPDWRTAGGAGMAACQNGSAAEVFSAVQPSVVVLGPSFRAPLRWTANLGVEGIRVHTWVLGVTGVHSKGINEGSTPDYNLTRTVGFRLASEADRPVWVSPGTIVPATGGIAPGVSRIRPEYGHVTTELSDNRSVFQQLQLTLNPPRPLFHGKLDFFASYTWSRSRTLARGFGPNNLQGTAGDPFEQEWSRGPAPTHQFMLTSGVRAWWFNVQWRANISSGIWFTPFVAGDINGDGWADNDRAFIPNPVTTPDSSLAAQMTRLLAIAPSGARHCLQSQLGKIAGGRSCHTEWQARLDLNLDFAPPSNWGYGDRLRVTMTMLNASGALVRLFGLQNTPLGQSALSSQPDATLLYVTGFDPLTQRFQYRVNQLFGEPANFETARHRFPPFQIQLGLEYKLGGPPTMPLARSIGLIPSGKQPAPTPAQVHDRIATRLLKNPVAPILLRRDSLELTPDQVSRLQALSQEYLARADWLMAPAVGYAVKKGKRVTDADLSARFGKAQPALAKLTTEVNTHAQQVLTAAQVSMLRARATEAP